MYTLLELQAKTFGQLKKIGYELNVLPPGDRRCRQSWIDAIAGVNPPLLQLLEVSPGVEVDRAQKPIIETVEASPAAEAEQVQEQPIESKFGRIVYPRPDQKSLEQAAQISPGVDLVDDELPECSNCFGDGYTEDEFGVVKFCQCEYEPRLSRQTNQCAIAPVAKNYLSDQNPILTGIVLSDRFVARYFPPQAQIVHFQSHADGQLSLLDFDVESVNEPPDPDDFESLDAFREAIARWDAQNPEPPAVSIASMCEWAPCPEEWYEPKAEILPLKASSMIELPEQSEVMELSITACSSITSDFFIPTFGGLGDRSDGSDEPPDTGIFARLPKPKLPGFPPQASQPKSGKVSLSQSGIPKLSRNYPETISATTQLIRSGANQQPARSPPGGDA